MAIRQMVQQGEFKPPNHHHFLTEYSRAKALFHELIYDKLNVEVIHAERTPKQREKKPSEDLQEWDMQAHYHGCFRRERWILKV